MAAQFNIRYHGWSSTPIECHPKALFFAPVYPPYCGAKWSTLDDYLGADVICVTHGHEEHFLDTPDLLRRTAATVVSSPTVCRFLKRRNKIPEGQLYPVAFGQPASVAGFRITTFAWKHRDINLYKAMAKDDDAWATYLQEWVFGVADHDQYLEKVGAAHLASIGANSIIGYTPGLDRR